MKKLVYRSIKYSVGTGSLGAIALIFVSDTIFRFWLGSGVSNPDINILLLLALYVFTESIIFVPFTVLMAQNQLKSLLLAMVVAAISGIVVMVYIKFGSYVIALVLPVANIVGWGLLWFPFKKLINSQWVDFGKVIFDSLKPAFVLSSFFILIALFTVEPLIIVDGFGIIILPKF